MAVKRKNIKEQTITPAIDIAEFRAWLAGVEDMQDDDWSPSPEQWGRIRAKILSVEDTGGRQVPVKKPLLVHPIQPVQDPDDFVTRQYIEQNFIQSAPIEPGITLTKSFTPDPYHEGGTAPVRNFATTVGSSKTPDIEPTENYQSSYV